MKPSKPIERSFRLPRVWSNHVLRTIAPIFRGEVINVSGWDDRDKEGSTYREYFSNAKAYYLSNYEGKRGLADSEEHTDFLLDLSGEVPDALRQRFDVAFCHTVLEHVFSVHRALENLVTMSRDAVIVVVPFAQELHFTDDYDDYWRFTPAGLRALFAQFGLRVVFEAANDDPNAGLYILMIGSRRKSPEWIEALPQWEPVRSLGGWIGRTNERRIRIGRPLRRVLRALRSRWSALLTALGTRT